MPKYILHGGRTRKDAPSNTQFFDELCNGLTKEHTILVVPFAQPESRWKPDFQQIDCPRFERHTSAKLQLASLEKFKEQVNNADVIYIKGGPTLNLLNTFKSIKGILRLLSQEKIYAATSAGANVLCKSFYSIDNAGAFDGLGIIPLKVLVHADDPVYSEKLPRLKQYNNTDTPVLMLNETEFTTLEI